MVGGQLAARVVRRRAWLIVVASCLAAAFAFAAASGARAAVPRGVRDSGLEFGTADGGHH